MSSNTSSPCKLPSKRKEQKREENKAFMMDKAEFNQVIKQLCLKFNALVVVNKELAKHGKGAQLSMETEDGTAIRCSSKDLRAQNARFVKDLQELRKVFSHSMKKSRDLLTPDSFAGTYTPVYAGPALTTFFTLKPENFGYVDPGNSSSGLLMDQLSLVKQGFMLRNTTTMLFYIYAHYNNLQSPENAQFTSADDVMLKAFGGDVPAGYVSYLTDPSQRIDPNVKRTKEEKAVKPVKKVMADAVAEGLLEQQLNTFDSIRLVYDFNPESFKTYFYQNIAAANYYSRANMVDASFLSREDGEKVSGYLSDEDARQQMLIEHNLVKDVSDKWHCVLEPDRKKQRDQKKKDKVEQEKRNRA